MKVACVQMCSGLDRDVNLATVDRLLGQAADKCAEVVLLPETFDCMGGDMVKKQAMAELQVESVALQFLSEQAVKYQITLVAGSLLLQDEAGRVRNSCPVFDATGSLMTMYDKIHLFDMDYQGESYHESAWIEAGSKPVSIQVGGFKAGLSICYDLRFPELFRTYVDDGCDILCNVAAFTSQTGCAHWQALLRARAIENQCYVLAAAQSGEHPDGRETWGHSMIIDPWGEVLSELAEGEGVIVADVSKTKLNQVRLSMPVLQHRKPLFDT